MKNDFQQFELEPNSYTYCTNCGEKLSLNNAMAWLAMDGTTHTYHKTDTEIPSNHIHQDFFIFGIACARSVIRNGGKLTSKKKR
jgi:hypothetical protein